MDWFKGNLAGTPHISWENQWFPVDFPLNQVHGQLLPDGWWYTYTSEKNEFVSWDDDIPNRWKVMKFMFQTTNQNIWTF
jgi:hypothetical protein